MATDDGDWRLMGQDRFLAKRRMKWLAWSSSRPDRDHDHCSFCSAEISDRPLDEHTAYNAVWVTDDDDYHWVCPPCFHDFRTRFEWEVTDQSA